MPGNRWIGWAGPLAVTAVAGILRFTDLGRPDAVVFDETYYAKDALALLRFGSEQAFLEGADDTILASDGNWRTLEVFSGDPGFVVHPPFGKWTIAAGEWLFGMTPFGWRFAVALLGTLSVLLVARIARRLTRSNLIGVTAGLLLALDGIHLVMSRTAILDMVISFWVLAAFGFLLLDRDQVRKRWLNKDALSPAMWGPRLGPRPWRWAAGISLGLACGVKWSGLWFVAVFGLMTVIWDVGLRRRIGVENPWSATLLRSAPPAFIAIVGSALVVYLATWTGWIRHRRRLGATVGRRSGTLDHSRLVALTVALPLPSLVIPRLARIRSFVSVESAQLVPADTTNVVLLSRRRGSGRYLRWRELLDRDQRDRQSRRVVGRCDRTHPSGMALCRASRLAFGCSARGCPRRLGPVAAVSGPHDLHVLHRRLRAVHRYRARHEPWIAARPRRCATGSTPLGCDRRGRDRAGRRCRRMVVLSGVDCPTADVSGMDVADVDADVGVATSNER